MELLKIRLEQFEGPLDLLLFLIQKNELDISSISLHKITDQYVQYVNVMRELNFDVASEFLLMAATLIFLKSKRLLPSEAFETASDEEDSVIPQSEEELLARLKEYKRYQEVSNQLMTAPRLDVDIFTRPGVEPPEKKTIWKEMDITELTIALQDVLRKSRKRTKVIIRESISLPERIMQISQILKVDQMTEFATLFNDAYTKSEVIVTFIAVLELSRLKKLKVYQNEAFGSIYVTLTEEISALDPKLMTGFQYKAHQSVAPGTAQEVTTS